MKKREKCIQTHYPTNGTSCVSQSVPSGSAHSHFEKNNFKDFQRRGSKRVSSFLTTLQHSKGIAVPFR